MAESERMYSYARTFFGNLTHVLCVIFTVFLSVLSQPGSSLFSWHPFTMTLAFSLIMTEALLLFSPHSSPVRKWSHKTKGKLHWILQTLCAISVSVGLGTISYNKHINNKFHFTSWHGLIGIVTVTIVGLQSVAALPLIYHKLAKGWSLAKLKRYHAASGLVTYLLGSVSLVLGCCSSWFCASVTGAAWYLAVLCPSLGAFAIMSQVTNAYMAKRRLQS